VSKLLSSRRWFWFSGISFGLVLLPLLLAMGAFWSYLGQAQWLNYVQDTYTWRVVWFSWWQASLSTVISLSAAVLVARALARRQSFLGRWLLLRCFSVALVVPSIIAVFGIILLHGKYGYFNQLWQWFGGQPQSYVYGLTGILLAHVFFNLPLASRILLQRFDAINSETWRLSSQLGMTSMDLWRHIEWPYIKGVLPQLSALVFALCFTSFAVVMTLGGGPKATTIEVAIFQAIRFDFDIAKAVYLSLLQMICCGFILWVGLRLGKPIDIFVSLETTAKNMRPDLRPILGIVSDTVILLIATLLVLLPLLAVVIAGINSAWADVLLDLRLWGAFSNSLWVALSSALLSLLMASGLLLAQRHWRKRYAAAALTVEWMGSVILVVPPLVLATGLFIGLSPHVNVFAINLYIVVLVNALMGLPYMLRVLSVAYLKISRDYDRLASSLGVQGWHRLRHVEWPILRKPIGLALALVAAMSAGDLGVVALFGSPDIQTLPLLMYQRLGSYQSEAAGVTAVVLLGLCLGIFVVIERLLGGAGD
jgi:thiamine transport system permease protein